MNQSDYLHTHRDTHVIHASCDTTMMTAILLQQTKIQSARYLISHSSSSMQSTTLEHVDSRDSFIIDSYGYVVQWSTNVFETIDPGSLTYVKTLIQV